MATNYLAHEIANPKMQYFTPIFQVATLSRPLDRLCSKIGGVPWGFPADHWPVCCGRPLKLLAQLIHEPPMLDLGTDGTVLHLFQCMDCLGINEPEGRISLILDRSQLDNGPAMVPGYNDEGEFGRGLIGEFFINGWKSSDDGIPPKRLPEFFCERELWRLQDEFPEINWFDGREQTRFGGSPRWTGNGPLDYPKPPYEFAFQLCNDLYIDGPLPTADEVGAEVSTYRYADGRAQDYSITRPDPSRERANAPWHVVRENGESYYMCEFTNLGTDGVVYVFIDRSITPHQVTWYWNR